MHTHTHTCYATLRVSTPGLVWRGKGRGPVSVDGSSLGWSPLAYVQWALRLSFVLETIDPQARANKEQRRCRKMIPQSSKALAIIESIATLINTTEYAHSFSAQTLNGMMPRSNTDATSAAPSRV